MNRPGSQGVIPKGWRLVRLGDVASLSTEQVKPMGNGSKPYVALEHIVSGGLLSDCGKESDSVSNKTTFCRGDTLYGKLRPNLRKVVRAEFDGVCSTEILAVRAGDSADGNFLSHLLRGEQLHGYATQGITGTKMPRTSWGHLKTFEFLSPPLPEQRAIAAVLDSIDDAIERAEAVIAATGRLRDSLLHQLLTRGVPGRHMEWKDVPGLGTIPAGWEVVRLEDGVTHVGSGVTPNGGKSVYTTSGITFLRSQNVYFDGLRLEDVVYIPPETDNAMSRSRVRPDDVLLNITGASIGRCTVAPGDLGPANVNQHVCIVRTQDGLQLLKESTADALLTRRVRVG